MKTEFIENNKKFKYKISDSYKYSCLDKNIHDYYFKELEKISTHYGYVDKYSIDCNKRVAIDHVFNKYNNLTYYPTHSEYLECRKLSDNLEKYY